MVTVPVSARSTSTTWLSALALSTACTTTSEFGFAMLISPRSQAARKTMAAAARAALELDRDTERWQKGKLGHALPGRRCVRVIEDVEKHVLRVVGVHDAQVRCDARAAEVIGPG